MALGAEIRPEILTAAQDYRAKAGWGRVAMAAAVLIAVAASTPDWKLLPPSFLAFDRDVLFYRESVEGTLAVGQDPGRGGAKYTFDDPVFNDNDTRDSNAITVSCTPASPAFLPLLPPEGPTTTITCSGEDQSGSD